MQLLQTLTLAEVKAKAREYYEAGKLTAQHLNPAERMCVNKGADGHRCAVAAAFNDELLEAYPRGSIASIQGVSFIDLDEKRAIRDIQEAHDIWAIAASYEGGQGAYAQRRFRESKGDEMKFVALISDQAT